MTIYPIFDEAVQVGEAHLTQQGQIIRIQCKCVPLCGKPRRLYMKSGQRVVSLGLCVPDGKEMSLLKRVSVREVGNEKPAFYVEGSQQSGNLFRMDEPFTKMAHLSSAKLQYCNGEYYILIDPSSSISTGQ